MKKFLLSLFTLFTFIAFSQTPFTAGNLVVLQVGSGGKALSNESQLIKLVEINPTTSAIVQTITLPYTTAMETGGNFKITAQGSSTNDGNLTISGNNAYFVFSGYNSDTGIASISGVANIKRVLARVGMNGVADTKTLLDVAKSTGNARCAASNDGSGFWLAGSTLGVRYMPYGSTGTGVAGDTGVIVSNTITNIRTIQIYGGDLIVGTGSSTVRLGKITGLPTNSGNTKVQFPGIKTNFGVNSVYMTSLPGGPAGLNTLYFASDATSLGIFKYCLNATTNNWDSLGVMNLPPGSATGFRALTGTTAGSTVTLYTSPSSKLYSILDATGYNVAPTASLVEVYTNPTNTAIRGVQIVPTILPLRLLSFNAAKNENGTAKIWWNVNGDDDVKSYIVEKSLNAKDFNSFATLAANGKNTYEINDNVELKSTTYYRVKFLNKNGSVTYSNVVAVTPRKSVGLEVFPNPVRNNLVISYKAVSKEASLSITNLQGKNVNSTAIKAGTTQTSIDISKLVNGTYIVTFLDSDGNKTSKTIIKK
ncbi:MAG: T9SS type A sorting domain-containing protein [Chitinophagaceae bacterium]